MLPIPAGRPDALQQSLPTRTDRGQATWRLRLVTYNCLSLCSLAQRECLCEQFRNRHVHIVALQETRRVCDPISIQGPYQVFASSPEEGQGGCQLWILRGRPLAVTRDGEEVAFRPEAASIFHSSPRLLVVLFDMAATPLAFIVAHSPTAVTAEPDLRKWWSATSGVIRRIPRKFQPVILIDANARFAAGTTFTATPEQCHNVGAHLLQDLMCAENLLISGNTDCQGEEIISWVGPKGTRTCLFSAPPFCLCIGTAGSWQHSWICGLLRL